MKLKEMYVKASSLKTLREEAEKELKEYGDSVDDYFKYADASKKEVGTRPLCDIAQDIRKDWKNVNFAAKPYLQAMGQLDKITDKYGMDDAKNIVSYFLANASSWKGETAKKIKQELKKLAGIK